MRIVAFTGYRPDKLPFVEDKKDEQYLKFRERLLQVINRLVERGYTEFISGVALGFDTWAAEDIIALKKENKDIHLECAIPFPAQAERWDFFDRLRYKKILRKADTSTTLCEQYQSNAYFIRNEYMVDKADVVVCCYDGQSGGTAKTVAYAKKKDKIIIQIDPNNARVSIISRRNFES